MANDKNYYSVQEVADKLDISKNTAYAMINRGELASYRVGRKVRVSQVALDDYINNQHSPTAARADRIDPMLIPPSFYQHQQISKPTHFVVNNDNAETQKTPTFIIGGQDAILDVLASYMQSEPYNIPALRSYMGSYRSIVELYKGDVSISSIHLYDVATETYNVPFIPHLLPGIGCYLINLSYRMLGLYVAKGNPKNIKSYKDMTRNDIKFVNRELGCGVRVLVDSILKKENISPLDINGYNDIEKSHMGVASNVSNGFSDFGIGYEKSALLVGDVDFIPIQKECLDIIIPKDRIPPDQLSAIFQILSSPTFQKEISSMRGYDCKDTGKIMAEF